MRYFDVLVLLSVHSTVFAFRGLAVPSRRNDGSFVAGRGVSSLPALIYGWDGDDDDTNTGSNKPSYMDYFGDDDASQCTPMGNAVAESISFNQDKAGHLARLAVAFSPPERSLKLKDIEKVEVVCVKEDNIEITAIICEDGGCVSLFVPITFPKACGSDDWLEGCVMRNIDELDEQAGSTLLAMEESGEELTFADLEKQCELTNSRVEFPIWWVPPECNAALAGTCDSIRSLLNDEEFQPDVKALAQSNLNGMDNRNDYAVEKVRVVSVGPAGIYLKAAARYQLSADKPIHILDVVHPFGGSPCVDGDSLRAAVLGAVASN